MNSSTSADDVRADSALLGGDQIDHSLDPMVCLGLGGAVSRLTRLRPQLHSWALSAGLPDDGAADMVLATYEALTNAAEHAYPNGDWTVDLIVARTVDARIVVSVRDTGRWRPPPENPGFRGRGLSLMASLADQIDVRPGPTGTTVLMWWRASRPR